MHDSGGGAHEPGRKSWRGEARPWHTGDVPFAFGNLDAVGADFLIGGTPDEHDRALSRRMLRSWADFAATGDPGRPAVSADTTPVRCWGVPGDHLADDDGSGLRALWRDVRFGLLAPGRVAGRRSPGFSGG
jgi:para-nitrobenzyl esterase